VGTIKEVEGLTLIYDNTRGTITKLLPLIAA